GELLRAAIVAQRGPGRKAGAGSVAAPEVGQAAADPPLAGFGVVAPLLGVAQAALLHVVAVDHPDLDLARSGAVREAARAELAVGGNADLLVALELQVGHRVGLPVFGVDQVPGTLEIAPAHRRRIDVLHALELAGPVAAAGGQ